MSAIALFISPTIWSNESPPVVLPNGWLVTPADVTDVNLGAMPIRMLRDPSGRWFITQQARGQTRVAGDHYLVVLDATTGQVAHRVPLGGVYHGMAFSDKGRTLFVSGGRTGFVYRFSFDPASGALRKETDLAMKPTDQGGQFSRPGHASPSWVGGIAVSEDGNTIYATAMNEHAVLARDSRLGVAKWTTAVSRLPYEILRDPTHGKLFVTSWTTSFVDVLLESTGRRLDSIQVGSHPNAAVLSRDGRTLFVACSYSNQVTEIDTENHRVRRQIDTAMYPESPVGSTSVGLTLTSDDRYLFVANADNNAVMMVETSSGKVVGAVPTGWYPTEVAVTSDDKRLFIISGLGSGVWKADFAIPEIPFDPKHTTPEKKRAFYTLYDGQQDALLQILPVPDQRAAAKGLDQVRKNSPYRPDAVNRRAKLPPIKHVIYIIRENKTYDSNMGDNPRGNGDPALCLFGQKITPNAHRLADEFVLLDNFFLHEGGSAVGHQYVNAGYAGDHVRRYARWGGPPQRPSFPDDRPPLGYLWEHALNHGVSVRNYWEGLREGQDGYPEPVSADPVLKGHMVSKWIDRYFDSAKADEWIRELRQFDQNGDFPQFQVIWLGQDHTTGTRPYYKTPNADVAENDWAVGRIIEALSHSRYWKDTVVFVIHDDSGQLPDHVGAARGLCLVAGGHVKRGVVDSTRYTVASILGTIERIFDLPTMTQFTASAPLMTDLFSESPDLRPWNATAPLLDINERNLPDNKWAPQSTALDLRIGKPVSENQTLASILWEYAKEHGSSGQLSAVELHPAR